mgnify:FL=1
MKVLSVNGQLISIGGLIEVSPPNTDICISPTELTNISYTGTTSAISVSGCTWNNTVVTDACDWIVTSSPVSPDPAGVNNNIQICENLTTSCRSGIVCYTPRVGETKCVTVCQSTGDTNIYVTPATISSISASGAYYSTSCIKVCGPTSNSVSVVSACDWIQVCNTPISPSATPGTSSCICVCSNAGAAREGYVTYTPTVGTAKTVCFCQVGALPIYFSTISDTGTNSLNAVCGVTTTNNSVGTIYCYNICKGSTGLIACATVCVYCNGVCIRGACIAGKGACFDSGFFAKFTHDYNDCVCVCTHLGGKYIALEWGQATIQLDNLTQCVGTYCIGTPNSAVSSTGDVP